MVMKAYYRQGKRLETKKVGGLFERGNDLIRNISAQAYICLEGGSPTRDKISENLINAVGVIEKITSLQSNISTGVSTIGEGLLTGAADLISSKIEDSLTPNAQELARCASDIYRKNLSQLGYNIFVRIRYEKFGLSRWTKEDEWNETFTSWEKYNKGGYGDGVFADMSGSYESIDDVKRNVGKAMKWEIKKFIENCKTV